MMKRYSIADARKHLPDLVMEAETGIGVGLTQRGEPVAVLLSLHEYERIKGIRRGFKVAYDKCLQRFDPEEVGLNEEFARKLRDAGGGRGVEV